MSQGSETTRRGARFSAGIPAILWESDRELECSAHDLSRTGVLLAGNLPVLSGSDRDLTLKAPSGGLEVRLAARAVRQTPEDGTIWRTLGYVLLGRGNYAEAEQALRKALELAPQDAVAMEHLGWLYQRAGRLGEAVASLKASLAINQNGVRARVILANVLLALDKPRRAATERGLVSCFNASKVARTIL